jgi:hypothetical protein
MDKRRRRPPSAAEVFKRAAAHKARKMLRARLIEQLAAKSTENPIKPCAQCGEEIVGRTDCARFCSKRCERKSYYETNREKAKAYYKANREKILANNKANRDETYNKAHRIYQKAYREANPT